MTEYSISIHFNTETELKAYINNMHGGAPAPAQQQVGQLAQVANPNATGSGGTTAAHQEAAQASQGTVVTLEELRAKASDYLKAGKTPIELQAILKEHGASSISALATDQYGAVLAKLAA